MKTGRAMKDAEEGDQERKDQDHLSEKLAG